MHLSADSTLLCPAGAIPVVGSVCNAVTGGVGSAAAGVGGSILGSGIGAIFDSASQWVAGGALWLLGQIGSVMSSTTSAGLGTSWFSAHESVMATMAAAVVLPMAFVGVIQAIYRQNASGLARSFLVHLPLAMLLTGVSVELVRLSLSVTDSMSDEVLRAGGVDTAHLLTPVTDFLSSGGPAGAGGFVVFVVSLVVVVCALVLWMELVVRAAAVTVATLFLPLMLAALVWPAVSHWCRRLADTLAALVLSKFVIASVISLAVGAIAGGLGTEGPNGGGISAVVIGIAMLLIAAVSPFTLLKLVPAVEAGAVAHLESARHRLTGAARAPLRAGRLALDVATTGGASSGAAALAGSVGTVEGGGDGFISGAAGTASADGTAGDSGPGTGGGPGGGSANGLTPRLRRYFEAEGDDPELARERGAGDAG